MKQQYRTIRFHKKNLILLQKIKEIVKKQEKADIKELKGVIGNEKTNLL